MKGVGHKIQFWIPISSDKHDLFSDHGRAKTHGGLPRGMVPPGDAAEAHWVCVREQETKITRENQMSWQCLAGAVRQQLMLRNLAILFILFYHKQVLGSPGWEGHADKKRKRNHFFSDVRDLCR